MRSNNKQRAVLLAGLIAGGSLLMTSAFAGPPTKKSKKPPVKKESTATLIADGKKVYAANGCANCHSLAGKGGKTGPDLTKVGADAKHTSKWLEEAIVNPKAHNPNSIMPSYEETIKGKNLKALVAYLGSLKK